MSNEVIMLANTYKKDSQLIFPLVFSEKLDGVAADFYGVDAIEGELNVRVRSRQDEPIVSVDHIRQFLHDKLPNRAHLICELYIPNKKFKDISGLVRRQEQSPSLLAFVYDYYVEGEEDKTYVERMNQMAAVLGKYIVPDIKTCPVQFIAAVKVDNLDDFKKVEQKFFELRPFAEGMVIRSLNEKSHYKMGWRSPGMLKHKVNNTIDLVISGFEEAISKDDKPLGMVGRIIASYKGQQIGVGPGKLKHSERKELFKNQAQYIGKIAEIVYMPDDSYEALREPRFYRWREDKINPTEDSNDNE